MKIFQKITRFLVKTPFYPYWLNNIKINDGNRRVENILFGDVLEVGAGDGSRKKNILKKNKKINKYLISDYDTWDSEFSTIDQTLTKYGELLDIIIGYNKRERMDVICSATDLPFDNESFDSHVSFEVLEHIDDPYKYFLEAARVVKRGGIIVLSTPFLFRMHGGEPSHEKDFFRYTNGFFYKIANDNNLELVEIYSNTGIGSTISLILNSKMILSIKAFGILFKAFLLLLSPFFFFITNIVGYLVDLAADKRFATRFHIIFKKR